MTSYRTLRVGNGWALVETSAPKALRHQIRAHFAAISHPLLGDVLYGGPPLPPGTNRHGQALHASRITWKGAPGLPAFAVESPLPPELEQLLA